MNLWLVPHPGCDPGGITPVLDTCGIWVRGWESNHTISLLQSDAFIPLGYRADDHAWGVIGPTPPCYLSPLNHA